MSELLRLNLGCGHDTPEGFVNVDNVPLPGVDVVADLDQPWPWKDATAEYIKASHIFEHIRNPIMFMTEAHRVLAVDGLLDIRVPGGVMTGGYWLPHPNSFTDPTHLRHCTPSTWDYWIDGTDLFTAYGMAMGGGRGGAVFELHTMTLNGEQGEELQAVLRKAGT